MSLVSPSEATRLRGIAIYCLAFFFFSVLDTFAKYAARYVPAIEVAWVRFLGHAVLAVLILRPWRDLTPYKTRRPLLQLLRSVLLFSSTIFNFIALTRLQLAETTSIAFATAFVVAGLAGPVLGEWIGLRRWIAILVGFVGVLIVARPGPAGVDPIIFLSLGSMFCNSIYVLLTRLLAPTESAGGMLLYPAVLASLMLAPVALPVAVAPPTVWSGIALVMTGICGAAGHWCLIQAHRIAPAGVLAPFVYSQILWMVALGYLVFDDLPHEATLIGAAVIVASGLYIVYRERVHGGR